MSRILGATFLGIASAAALTVWATVQRSSTCVDPDAATTTASAGSSSCDGATRHEAGSFDATMSGVCRSSCATPVVAGEHVVAQPGAKPGELTRCPVSGVVFAVDARRPRVHLASGDYVLCCDRCAQKLRDEPARFVKT
jgi:hypothetical protein